MDLDAGGRTISRVVGGTAVLMATVFGAVGCGPKCEDIGGCAPYDEAGVQVTFDEFTRTELGDEQVREIRFESVGEGTLRVTTVELVEEDGDGQDELFAVGWDGSRWDGPVFRLAPGESATLPVAFRPQNKGEDRGYVDVLTNDPDRGEIRVDLQPPAPKPELFVSPKSLRWRAVLPVNDPEWRGEPRSLELHNPGTAPLEISDIQIEGDDVFYWTLQQCTSGADGGRICLPEDDVESLPGPISPGESAYLRVYYRPNDRLPNSATLLISSSSRGGETVEVSLEGS